MKKLFSLLLFVVPTVLYAQLKVESDGKVLVGDHHWNSEYVNLESYSIFSSSQSKPIVVGLKTHSGSFYDNGGIINLAVGKTFEVPIGATVTIESGEIN